MVLPRGGRGVDSIGSFFSQFKRPWLAALAAAGGIWFGVSLPVAVLGRWVHPTFNLIAGVLHILGSVTLVVAGVLFAVLWWKKYLDWKFFSGANDGSSE